MKIKIRYRANPHQGYRKCIQIQLCPGGKWRNVRNSRGHVCVYGTLEEAELYADLNQQAIDHTISG